MGKSLTLSAILGGLVVFLWMNISWVALPWHKATMHQFENEGFVADVIQRNAPQAGIYVIPGWGNYSQGQPFVSATVIPEGMKEGTVGQFIIQLIVEIIAAFIITLLLIQTKAMRYIKQVGFVTLAGLFAGITAVFPEWIWGGYPLTNVFLTMLDLIIAWFLAGLVIGRIAKVKS